MGMASFMEQTPWCNERMLQLAGQSQTLNQANWECHAYALQLSHGMAPSTQACSGREVPIGACYRSDPHCILPFAVGKHLYECESFTICRLHYAMRKKGRSISGLFSPRSKPRRQVRRIRVFVWTYDQNASRDEPWNNRDDLTSIF